MFVVVVCCLPVVVCYCLFDVVGWLLLVVRCVGLFVDLFRCVVLGMWFVLWCVAFFFCVCVCFRCARRALYVVCCLLLVVCCLLFVVRCVLFAFCRLPFVVCGLFVSLCLVRHSLFVVCFC